MLFVKGGKAIVLTDGLEVSQIGGDKCEIVNGRYVQNATNVEGH